MRLATSEEMRAMDRRATEEFGIPSIVLMENAALRVVEYLERVYAPLNEKSIAVLCGKGNNGGDGLAIARHLHTRFGESVFVYLLAAPASLKGDAAANLAMAEKCGVSVAVCASGFSAEAARDLSGVDFIVDAIFGTGFHGVATGAAASAIEAANASGHPIVAVDVPSGVDADTGHVEGPAIRAAATVTLALGKPGLYLYPAVDYCGKVVVGHIGFPSALTDGGSLFVTGPFDVAGWLPGRQATRDANKGKFGHVSVFAGSAGFLGAANLAASGAARAGAGLVTLCVPESLLDAAMAMASYTLMTSPMPQTPGREFSFQALDKALETAGKGTAAAIGPGIGRKDPDTVKFAVEFIRQCPVPLVIDADALTILSEQPGRGAEIVKARTAAAVLTPHPGEMARLLGITTAQVQDDRMQTVRSAADSYGCVALLKGSRTLIASPDGRVNINLTGNPGMASGGMGDALTGICAAFLGMKGDAHDAASSAAYVHGLAGDLAVKRIRGTAGLLATDLIDAVPEAMAVCMSESAQEV
jgi:NAD(P)H-hydrate epimerase